MRRSVIVLPEWILGADRRARDRLDARRTPVIDPICEKTYHVMGDEKTLAARWDACTAHAQLNT